MPPSKSPCLCICYCTYGLPEVVKLAMYFVDGEVPWKFMGAFIEGLFGGLICAVITGPLS